MEIRLSNRVEQLYELLKKELFGSGGFPFRRRIVIVPSPAMKSWLMMRLAQDPEVGIAAGLEVLFLEPGIAQLREMLVGKQDHLPSTLEMAFQIEVEMRNAVKRGEWEAVREYLKTAPRQPLSRRSERRLVKLSETIACLFREYGRYGGEMLTKWENTPTAHWQQDLWKSLFSTKWSYPYREFAKPVERGEREDTQVFLFAISFLSKSQHSFFKKIAEIIPVHLFLLSPCLHYWSDIRSDRETKALFRFWQRKGISKAENEALEEFLRDRNPLLANFGRLGRHMAEQIEECDTSSVEYYSLPEGVCDHPQYEELVDIDQQFHGIGKPLSMLDMVQADIALMRNPQGDKIDFSDDDATIQIHISSSKLREVQNLYDTVMRLIDRQKNDDVPLTPSDIVVMAPNIVEYEPFIRAVFECHSSTLGCQIMDLTVPLQSRLIQGFLHLIDLPSSRWEASALLSLFDHPAFQRRHGLTAEETAWIRAWVREAGIRWGKNSIHRNEVLGEDKNIAAGTWEHGFELIIRSLISGSDARCGILAAIDIETSQSPTLGTFIRLIRHLYADLTPLGNGTALQIDEWSLYLECLLDSYFSIDFKSDNDEEERALLKRHLSMLRHAGRQIGIEQFTFTSIKLHLKAALEQEQVSYREHHLQAVRFCSMLPMRAIPAKVVALIGMEEGAFPKRSSILSLDYLRKDEPVDYCPTQTDYDRYLFLEMLLSARHTFILSYCGAEDQPPSTLVSELTHYLDNACTVEGQTPSTCRSYHHPFRPYDKCYFSDDSTLHSYSMERYRAAVAYYNPEKIPPHQFIEGYAEPAEDVSDTLRIDIRQLTGLAKNPLKHYFNNTLNMYLVDNEEEPQDDDEIALNALENAMMVREGLKRPLDSIFCDAESRGLFPSGVFKELAQERVANDHAELIDLLREAGINYEELVELIFSPSHTAPESLSPRRFCLPPLRLELDGKEIEIVGTLPLISKEGLIAFVEDSKEHIFTAFAELIILSCAVKRHNLPIAPCIIPTKGKKRFTRTLPGDDPFLHLHRFLRFFFETQQHPCPLVPEWIDDLISSTDEEFDNTVKGRMDDSFQKLHNPYICWIAPTGEELNAPEIYNRWKESVNLVYGEAKDAWYPQKEKEVIT